MPLDSTVFLLPPGGRLFRLGKFSRIHSYKGFRSNIEMCEVRRDIVNLNV